MPGIAGRNSREGHLIAGFARCPRAAISRTVRVLAALLLTALLAPGPAGAQGYPSRPIKVLVGFPPGGGADLTARIVGEEVARALGQPVIVENRPGAGGTTVLGEVAKAEPDGHTLLVTPSGYALLSALAKPAPFDSPDGFTWIANVIDMPFYILVHDDAEVTSLADLVARAKAAPGTLAYGSAGQGSAYHLLVEQIGLATGATFVHVPYRGDAPIATDLLGRHLAFAPMTSTGLASNLGKGRLRALAVTTAKRWPTQPEVPTVAEALGLADFHVATSFSFAGPPRLPKAIVARLNAEVARASTVAGVRTRLDTLGGQVNIMSADDLAQRATRELSLWNGVVDRLGLARP